MTLGMTVEGGADPRAGPRLHKEMVRSEFVWLDPPSMEGRMNVTHVLVARTPAEHRELVTSWAEDVWDAWRPHHQTVRRWIGESLGAST